LLLGCELNSLFDDEEFLKLSRAEFTRLCAAGLWLEGLLIHRVTEAGLLSLEPVEARVMLQEVREECGHSLMFLEMIDRAGDGIRPQLEGTSILTSVAKKLKIDSAEFWAMAYIGETVTDNFATRALRLIHSQKETVCPLAEEVLAFHHREEARHIAAARQFLARRLSGMSSQRRWLFSRTLQWLLNLFLDATMYPSAESLKRAGLSNPTSIARLLKNDVTRKRLAAECARSALSLVSRDGWLSVSCRATGGAK
tara:strand:- start:143 stop:904 length:762 start_codon:yes stop_codon:yes gene_type:complete